MRWAPSPLARSVPRPLARLPRHHNDGAGYGTRRRRAHTFNTNKCSLMCPASSLSTRAAHSVNTGEVYEQSQLQPASVAAVSARTDRSAGACSADAGMLECARASLCDTGTTCDKVTTSLLHCITVSERIPRGRRHVGVTFEQHALDGQQQRPTPAHTRPCGGRVTTKIAAHRTRLPQSAGNEVHAVDLRARELLQHASLAEPSQRTDLGLQRSVGSVDSWCSFAALANPSRQLE